MSTRSPRLSLTASAKLTGSSYTGDGELIQAILDNSLSTDAPIALHADEPPALPILSYNVEPMSVAEAIRDVCLYIGWDQAGWRSSTSQFELTLYDPDPAPRPAPTTFDADRYLTIDQCGIDANIRNVVVVWYWMAPPPTATKAVPENHAHRHREHRSVWAPVDGDRPGADQRAGYAHRGEDSLTLSCQTSRSQTRL